jgi:hypothetical protein
MDCVNDDVLGNCPYINETSSESSFIKLIKEQKEKGTFFELFGVSLAGMIGLKTLMECICWT